MRKKILTFLIFLSLFFVSPAGAIPNPAPIYCENMGYVSNGTRCVFNDGKSCELWAFYNGKCGQDYLKELPCKKLGESVPPGYNCCEGLNSVGVSSPGPNNTCSQSVGSWGICIACGDGICAKINPSKYGNFENECNCPLDCSAQVCKPEGYEYWVNPITKDFQCCEGLQHISRFLVYYPKDRICGILQDWSLCSNRGNGICEEWEHACTCQEDCEFASYSEQSCPAGCICGEDEVICPTYSAAIKKMESAGPGPTSCEANQIWDYQLKKCVPATSTTPAGPAINCPVSCVCKGNAVSCPSENQTITSSVSTVETSSSATQSGVSTTSATTQISIGKTSSGAVTIKQGNVKATATKKINVMESKVYMETSSGVREVKILPKEALSKATEITTVKEIELKEEDTKLIYSIKGTKPAGLLFIIPVEMEIETKVNAETGNIISVNKPWWSFLAW